MTPQRTWPMPTAVAALVLFAIVVPLGCMFFGFLSSFSLAGGTPPTDDAQDVTRGLFIAAAISALLAIGLAIASAIGARTIGVRVVAVLAILVALVTGGFPAVLLLSELRSNIAANPPPAEPAAASCGPESHPVVFGGDSRYQPCADDAAAAADFLDTAVTGLPIENVTVAAVDAIASGIEPDSYDHTTEVDGAIVVAWFPAPVTCALATWRDGFWSLETTGMLADGGCIYTGG